MDVPGLTLSLLRQASAMSRTLYGRANVTSCVSLVASSFPETSSQRDRQSVSPSCFDTVER